MSRQLDVSEDEPEGCCLCAGKRVIMAVAVLLMLLAPCNIGSRVTTFEYRGETHPAKCWYRGNSTLGCTIYTD